MPLNGIMCAEVSLRIYSFTQSRHYIYDVIWCAAVEQCVFVSSLTRPVSRLADKFTAGLAQIEA